MTTDSNASPTLLWNPSETFRRQSRLTHYLQWLAREKDLEFDDYQALWEWSVDDLEGFWTSIADYFEVIFHQPYRSVLSGKAMPDFRWFSGATLNYAEHAFRHAHPDRPAILFRSERHELIEIGWAELRQQVASMRAYLQSVGVSRGDRVVAFLPNIPEATIAFLAACSLGAIWSSCSPDFGVNSVVDRFQQIEPKVLFAVDGYQYNGKAFDKQGDVQAIREQLPTVEQLVLVPYLQAENTGEALPGCILWNDTFRADVPELTFDPVPFEHPIWVLYSSGTTGIPKAITHSHGGVLLEHFKYLAFHNDLHEGERFFWFSTTGWMMWNFVQASLLLGATIVLYDGSPGYPDLNALWKFTEEAGIHHFGTSAPYMVACMKQGLEPGRQFDLRALRSIGSTGAPLPPEAFDWAYRNVKEDLWLCSMSGGTDVCTAFVGGCPLLPVYLGEIQCRGLGCSMEAWDDLGNPLIEEVGEMVVTRPMPSMPIYFWNDPGKKRYLSSYFEMFPGIWRHGDWLKITSRGTLVILGRSDATLNRQGVRIGTAEIYRSLHHISQIKDSLIVNLELANGEHYMPLFVVLEEGKELDEELTGRIRRQLREDCSPRHVPDEVLVIPEIPYTISGKKLEAPVKKILLGMPMDKAANRDSMKNPESLDYFLRFREVVRKRG